LAERLARLLWAQGIPDEAALQQMSAASCYAKAGVPTQAVALLQDLLDQSLLSPVLRDRATGILPRYQQQVALVQEKTQAAQVG
jgi:hypothetical protein